MRDKQAIEIIGAIDLDPAKAERDLGEVVGASDAPWGVKVFADPQQALDLNADVVIHATSSSLAKVMDKFVLTLAAVSQRIEQAKALRIVDASQRRLPLQKKIGAGLSVDEFRTQVKAGVIKHVGLPESVAMVADSLNLPVENISETIEPKVASERVATEYLTVEKGQAAGVHQIAHGLSKDGKELVHLELQMYVGAKDPSDTITLTGHPNISLTIPGGSH